MKRQVMRVVAGVNLVAGCLLLQGCSTKKADQQPVTALPEEQPVEVTQVEPAMPVEVVPVAELPVVQATTPYTIKKGDTISSVAYRYYLRWQDVVAVNPGLTPTRLRIGQVIQLPGQVDLGKVRAVPASAPRVTAPKTSAPKAAAAAGATVTYTVVAGDSLSVIAHKHGVKTAAIREANNLTSDRINVGQKLKVPGATKSAAKPAVAKKEAAVAAAKTDAPKPVAPKPPEVTPSGATPPPAPVAVESEPVKIETAPPPVPVADANVQTYTVKEGEDLYAVAIRWGVSPSDLKALNNLTSTELKAGTVLKIPGGVQ